MLPRREEIERLGVGVVFVTFTKPDKIAAYLASYPVPCTIVCDPSMDAYRTFDLGRATWRMILKPGLWWRAGKVILRGWLPKIQNKGEDVWQLGGDFVLDRERRLVYAYRSQDPADRPSVNELLDVIKTKLKSGK